jgi:hypothetical protein
VSSSRRRSHAASALRRTRTPPPGSRTAGGPARWRRQRWKAARDTRSSAVTSSIVSSGSPGVPGAASGVAGGPAGSGHRSRGRPVRGCATTDAPLRPPRQVRPRLADDCGQRRGAAGNEDRRETARAARASRRVRAGGPVLPEGKAGGSGLGVARAVTDGAAPPLPAAQAACPPAARDRRHPASTPPVASSAGTRPARRGGLCGRPVGRWVPRRARHRGASARVRRAARWPVWAPTCGERVTPLEGICHVLAGPSCRCFSAHYRNQFLSALFHAPPGDQLLAGKGGNDAGQRTDIPGRERQADSAAGRVAPGGTEGRAGAGTWQVQTCKRPARCAALAAPPALAPGHQRRLRGAGLLVREQGLPAATVLIPACRRPSRRSPHAGSADRAAKTAAAGLSPTAGATGAGPGSSRGRRHCGPRPGQPLLVHAMVVTPFLILRRHSC